MTGAVSSPLTARDVTGSAAGPDTPSRELVLSPSRVRAYLQCPACFAAQYIEGRPEPSRSIAMPIGSGIHAGAAEARRSKLYAEQPDVDNSLAVAEMAFVSSLKGESEPGYTDGQAPLEWELGKYTDMGTPLDDCIRLTRRVIEEIVAKEGPALAIEQEIDFSEIFPFPFRGTIDVRLTLGEGEEIRDLKSAARQGVPDSFAALQICTYALPDWAAGRDIMVGIDQIAKTKDATVTRYDLAPSNDELAAVCSLVSDVADKIHEGYFPPRPGFFKCSFGPHELPRFSLPVEWPAP